MKPGKKVGGVALLIGAPKGDSADDTGDDSSLDAAKVGEAASVRSLFSAMKADDPEAGRRALKAFLTACGALDDEAEPDESDEKY